MDKEPLSMEELQSTLCNYCSMQNHCPYTTDEGSLCYDAYDNYKEEEFPHLGSKWIFLCYEDNTEDPFGHTGPLLRSDYNLIKDKFEIIDVEAIEDDELKDKIKYLTDDFILHIKDYIKDTLEIIKNNKF
jgi:hypothetical protein